MKKRGRPTRLESEREFRRRAFDLVIGELIADIERQEWEIDQYRWAIDKLREMLPRDDATTPKED